MFNVPKDIDPDSANHYVLKTSLIKSPDKDEEEILFGCGCFWGAEKGFWKLPGVITTAVGYSGGELEKPTYRQVCSGSTGHAEVVKVVWNIKAIDLSDLLKLFWECHDPTQGNRQGNDRGSQYRSAIFTSNQKQKKLTYSSRDSYQSLLSNKGYGEITTEISDMKNFFYAEGYHQQYLAKPGSRPYCSAMPTKVHLETFEGENFKLNKTVWSNFNWSENHCVLRSSIDPITETTGS